MSRRRTTEDLHTALEEAALAGAQEIRDFLSTYRGKDPERLRRVQIAVGAVSGYTRWRRFDLAFVGERLAIEIDGGAFLAQGGRHTRGSGYRQDCEKLAEAVILGWRVLRVLPEHVTSGAALTWIERTLGCDSRGHTGTGG